MSREFKRFIIKIFAAAVFMVAIGGAVFTFIIPEQYIPVLPWMLLFFALITIITHGYQMYLAKKDMALFTRSSMLISLIRLAVYSIFTIIYLAGDPDNVPVFVICIVIVYIVFSFTEVVDLSRISKENGK